MAHAGLIVDNPVSGERFVFTTTAEDTEGELLAFEWRSRPAAASLAVTSTRRRRSGSRSRAGRCGSRRDSGG
jgi:hypothetical protein